ncbi:pyruvate, phosphate dikinase [Erythrobacteraceae bacterium CFH 75059]|uniref:pyruvate, phosphate dikinase n=1 Tax=Qipengyuania thermophila TaxID=2509361 RepID=UPI00101F5316|nr:pyruvate, phosphate dikinase [Qipengyuania thermophila]TCD05159.1 pyruvate, phosphate dikinase [Erythrobacteraceae bacterium CFH 75059]
MVQTVYNFGGGAEHGDPRQKDKTVVGGKGANLAEMASIGLPVPPGFTITTEECRRFSASGVLHAELREAIAAALERVETSVGRRFGDTANPLLLSVRSGAAQSMPGMMDTVLNLGLNDDTVRGLAGASANERFAWDSYRRFIQMYGDVVMGVDHGCFEEALEIAKEERGFLNDTELDAGDLRALVDTYKDIVRREAGAPFPQDVHEQLAEAIAAVFRSWNSERARIYRRLNAIADDCGTAVNVQAMVFGNRGENSATGVVFTRDPATGERTAYGEWLPNAQGEDVVAGIRTPQYLTRRHRERAGAKAPSMEEALPRVHAELTRYLDLLERHYRDMQDVEFTVEEGDLYLLQTRSGKRTAAAALRMAVDMVAEGLINEEDAVLRVEPMALDQLLHPTLDPDASREVLCRGLPASPGAATGRIVLDAATAEAWAARGEHVLLCRTETSPEDIGGMHAARGILTTRGGMTSHAAVVARGMGRPCVCGASDVVIDMAARSVTIAGHRLAEGDAITIDGSSGEVMAGTVPTREPELTGAFGDLMLWADRHRRMRVRTNAETPDDCAAARRFGAEGVGLCRTEHMFFQPDRIRAVRRMILAGSAAERDAALDALLPAQRADFARIFEIMAGLPCTIRLLDPPLHEFLPHSDADFDDLLEPGGPSRETLMRRAAELREVNPMLGHRGCRLGITYPEIYAMQARAIFEAACDVADATGSAPVPELMIPLVATAAELAIVRDKVEAVAREVMAGRGRALPYSVGTMIELPRAALTADAIAAHADFFSFGTNDLTQTTLGISRDDAGSFIHTYLDQGIFTRDPFVGIDRDGVGRLIRMAAELGRGASATLKLGICGEHGGDPDSIAFCEEVGLDYVSASPYRVPIARLAAAQASLRARRSAGPAA